MRLEMNENQRKTLADYCVSTSKAVFIAALVGALAGKTGIGAALAGFAGAMVLLAIGLVLV